MHLNPIISCHLSSVDTDAPPTTQHRQRLSVKGLIEFIFRACTDKNYPSIIKCMLIHARRTMIATKPMTVTRIGTSSHTIFAGGEQLQAVKVNWHSCRCSHAFDGELAQKRRETIIEREGEIERVSSDLILSFSQERCSPTAEPLSLGCDFFLTLQVFSVLQCKKPGLQLQELLGRFFFFIREEVVRLLILPRD